MKTLKRLSLLIPVIIAVICLYAFSGADSDKIRISQNELSVVAEVSDESLLVSTAEISEMKEIAASGMLKMYLDEKTMSICIYDAISDTLYRSLPEEYSGEKTSVLSVGILLDGREYTLCSQSDSLSFGCAGYEMSENGITVTYSFRRSLEGRRKLDITVPITYTLTDGMLTAGVDCSKIICEGKAVITRLSLLEFFGADRNAQKGDYILLPEGCGATIDLSQKAESFEEIILPIYGCDPAVGNSSPYNAAVGAFGRKCKSSAFVCLVSQGESLCEISACKASADKGSNRVGATFNITPLLQNDKYIYISNNSYEGTLQLCYRFLNTDNADYIGMASAVRELLIRQGKLRESTKDNEDYYPFNLSLKMTEEKPDEKGKMSLETLTSFNQAYELIASLKSKGFGDMNVRLKGSLQKDEDFFACEDKSHEKELMLSAGDDGSVRFYPDSFIFARKDYAATNLQGDKLQSFSAAEKIKDGLGSYISELRKQNIYGVCVSSTLSSDFGKRSFSLREDVKNSHNEILSSIGASRSVMNSAGNLYSIKYSDLVIDLPQESALEKRGDTDSVPFLQAIIHGITDYSHSAANLSEDITLSALKAVEYGALPHFEWHCTASREGDTSDKAYYMDTVSQAKALHDKMKADFAPLRGKRITAHKKVKDNVYLTRFGEECSVYVNYSDNAVSVAGVTVGAKSYAVVN